MARSPRSTVRSKFSGTSFRPVGRNFEGGVWLRLTKFDLSRITSKLQGYMDRIGDMSEVLEDAADYMVRSVRYRIEVSKKGPNGQPWADLKDSTVEIKGHDVIMEDTGRLAESIHADYIGRDRFVIEADTEYAEYQQYGIISTKGWIKGKRVPARPFMGVSETNFDKIGRLIRNYVADLDDRADRLGME